MFFLKNNRSQIQGNVSWKETTNSVLVPKNVKNYSTTSSNNIESLVWPRNCELKAKYKFNPNPINHYRKQYVPANSFSNNSFIGFLDKPGNYIVTDSSNCKTCANENSQNIHLHILHNRDIYPNSGDWYYDTCLNRMVCTGCNPQSLIIKPSRTILDKNYSSSNKEYLYKKCKTFDQNYIKSDVSCNNHNFGCNSIIKYSNINYQNNGPVTSSSRITSLKYGCSNPNNRRCVIRRTGINDNNLCGDLSQEECNNRNQALQNPGCVGCITDNRIRRKRINILH